MPLQTQVVQHIFLSTTPVCNKQPANDPIAIHTPSSAIIHSTHEADLDCPTLPPAAHHGHIILQLVIQPLLSIGQLCNASCNVTFTATDDTIIHNGNNILAGYHTPATKLWHLDIQLPSKQLANAAIGTAKPAELVCLCTCCHVQPCPFHFG